MDPSLLLPSSKYVWTSQIKVS
uniref:Uncharacterized protein n=1 Tax=Arundo donax TaxID=35708 RepID=A0A0A9BV77_ARUDO